MGCLIKCAVDITFKLQIVVCPQELWHRVRVHPDHQQAAGRRHALPAGQVQQVGHAGGLLPATCYLVPRYLIT